MSCEGHLFNTTPLKLWNMMANDTSDVWLCAAFFFPQKRLQILLEEGTWRQSDSSRHLMRRLLRN